MEKRVQEQQQVLSQRNMASRDGEQDGYQGQVGMGMYVPPRAYPQQQQVQMVTQQQMQMFWSTQMQEMEGVCDFKNHQLPLARIKKIMKADEDVRMISAEAPVLFAKACEMFILEVTLRSWIHAEENKRRTLQKNDIAAAITRTDIFDFLVDIVPREEASINSNTTIPPSDATAHPYYYPAGPGVVMGRPALQTVDPHHQTYFHNQQQHSPFGMPMYSNPHPHPHQPLEIDDSHSYPENYNHAHSNHDNTSFS